MPKSREIKIATITVTVLRRKKHSLLPGWEYGTNFTVQPTDVITPKDVPIVEQMFDKVRKAL